MKAHLTPAFAALGHQENWGQIARIVGTMRTPPQLPLTDAELREVVPWIPPRTVSRLHVAAADDSAEVAGIYIETFITPDELAMPLNRRILEKVRDGIKAAEREGARVVTLGGFTSILLEGTNYQPIDGFALTTGNSLTAALIVRGIERAASLLGRPLDAETLLVIGATGDVGSACARSFAGRTRQLLLAARNQRRLDAEAALLRDSGPVTASTNVTALLRQATMIVAVASTVEPTFTMADCHPDAVVCDAGYPKNICVNHGSMGRRRIFWGGMGVLGGGIRSDNGVVETIYRFPRANVAHGCMLEGMVLAIASRYESFSVGRGRITPARVEEMWQLASASGVTLAPLFDSIGVWPEEAV